MRQDKLPDAGEGSVPSAGMNMTQRLALLETAQELCQLLAAVRSAEIRAEESKPTPDQAAIERLQGERARLVRESMSLSLGDVQGLQRVIDQYGPQARAAYAA
ncbi:hypothetical protein [Xenophilus azovorans]|uniref:hypothetical protein n=1 Tax=Xenophilus azovorans TaxID=151755 RepID=UPI0005711B37|nr:hypothetical protein [Xenophilus azovorans]